MSIEFYDKCNKIIINYFVNEFKKMNKSTLEEKIKRVEEQMKKLTLEHEEVVTVKDDKTFTLDLPLYGAETGEPVTIYPGCDWTMTTSDEVYDNALNYGGRRNVPNLNPVTSNAFQ